MAKRQKKLTRNSVHVNVQRIPRIDTPRHIVDDTDYTNIGDLPTGFLPYRDIGLHEIYLRPLRVSELSLIYRAAHTKTGVDHLIRAMNACSSVDLSVLTDGDFAFCMAWMRKQSYPETPIFVRWTCVNKVQAHAETNQRPEFDVPEDQMPLYNLHYRPCDNENNELVYNGELRIVSIEDDARPLPDFMDYPRIRTLGELHTLERENPADLEMAKLARWVRKGTTLAEKLNAMDELSRDQFVMLMTVSKNYFHGIYENLPLRCRSCDFRTVYRNDMDVLKFFADNSEKNILDIQYSLLVKFSLQPDENMPVKRLLYHNACLAKDLQEEEERRRLQATAKGKSRRSE